MARGKAAAVRSAARSRAAVKPRPARSSLRVGAAHDSLEREADQMAAAVMAAPKPGKPARAQFAATAVHSRCTCGSGGGPCSACRERQLQRKATGSMDGLHAPDVVDTVLASSGSRLDDATRIFMEERFGRRFDTVRIHTDAAAVQSAHLVHSRAYTLGHHIVFNAGQYSPHTDQGRHLLAHELAHVAQQTEGIASSRVLQRNPEATPAEATPTRPYRKVVRQKVYVDQNRIVYEFESGPPEERTIERWNARDPVPGVYRFTERGETDEWVPSSPWLKRENLDDRSDSRLWVTEDPVKRHVGEQCEIEIIGGQPAQEVRSLREAQLAMSPEMRELLVSKAALPIRSRDDEYIAYQIIRDLEREGITSIELLRYQNEHPAERRAQSYAEVRRGFNDLIAATREGRVRRGSEEMALVVEGQALAGDTESYKKDNEFFNAVPLLKARGNFARLAEFFRTQGDEAAAARMERALSWVRQFEKVAVEVGRQLLTDLELVLRMDSTYIAASDTPAYQDAQWGRMQTALAEKREKTRPLYDVASEHSERAEALSWAAETTHAEAYKAEAKVESEIAETARKKANALVIEALPNLRAAKRFPDFPYRDLAGAADPKTVARLVEKFINEKRGAVIGARNNLLSEPEQVHKLDVLVQYAKKQAMASMGVDDSTLFDQILADRAAAIEAEDDWIDDLLMIVSIALSFVPGVNLLALTARGVALAADVTSFYRELDKYNDQDLAYRSGMGSQEASSFGVILAGIAAPAGQLDVLADVGKSMGKLDLAGDVAKVSDTSTEAAAKLAGGADEAPPAAVAGEAATGEARALPDAAAGEARVASDAAAGEARVLPDAAAAEAKPLATEPAVGKPGHEIEMAEDGAHFCSPRPCPLIRNIYARELDQFPELRSLLDEFEELRRSKPQEAAKKVATLEKRLGELAAKNDVIGAIPKHARPADSARLKAMLDNGVGLDEATLIELREALGASRSADEFAKRVDELEQHVAGAAEARNRPRMKGRVDAPSSRVVNQREFELQIGKERLDAIAAGDKDFYLSQDLGFHVDERQAVGGFLPNGTRIDPAEAMRRARDPGNRQLLDPMTNTRTKYRGDEVPSAARTLPVSKTPVSVAKDPSVVFTRTFDEVPELMDVFREAERRVDITGMTASEVKAAINRNIRLIIAEGQTASGAAIRDALRRIGYEWRANKGIVGIARGG